MSDALNPFMVSNWRQRVARDGGGVWWGVEGREGWGGGAFVERREEREDERVEIERGEKQRETDRQTQRGGGGGARGERRGRMRE